MINRKAKILIVDDDIPMANTLRDILIVKEFDIEIAYSGKEAIKKADEFIFDCILTDIRMPEIDGVELCKIIKEKYPDVAIIFMTAYSSDDSIKMGLKYGAIASITKPIDIDRILRFFSFINDGLYMAIIDDDPVFCKTLKEILELRKISVKVISDTSNVMENITGKEEIILLDLKLKEISGMYILEKIRAKFNHVPVILITGYKNEMEETINICLKMKIHACLYKPFDVNSLICLLEEFRKKKIEKLIKGKSY